MRITARVDYAVRAALELAAAAPEALTADRIATAQGIPARFLQAILGDLQRAHLVTSQRGRDGGYRLALPRSEISIARVMRIEQGFLAEVHGQRPEDVVYPGAAAGPGERLGGRAGGLPPGARAGHARRRRRRHAARPGGRAGRDGERLALLRRRPRRLTADASGTLAAMSAAQRPGVTVFLTGLSGAGKSTIADALVADLEADGRPVTVLDGDVVRTHLSSELTFSREHRDLNIRRIGWVAGEVVKHGGTVVVAAIAPYETAREEARQLVEKHGRFVLVHLATPLEVCEQRDVKGLYAKARAGEIPEFTGVSDPYEPPARAEVIIDTSVTPLAESVARIRAAMERHPQSSSCATPRHRRRMWHHRPLTDRGSLLVARLHIDLALVSSAACRPQR